MLETEVDQRKESISELHRFFRGTEMTVNASRRYRGVQYSSEDSDSLLQKLDSTCLTSGADMENNVEFMEYPSYIMESFQIVRFSTATREKKRD
jgi:hypothetical protein